MNSEKRRNKLIVFFLVLLMALTFAVPGFAASKHEDHNMTVKVGYFEFGGMFEGAGPDKRKSGYCYDYMMQMSTYTGWNYEFVYGSYSELYEKLKRGEIDILPYTNYNEQRGQEVLFSDNALLQEEYYIAVKPETFKGDKGVEALNGSTISTITGADYNALLDDYISEHGLNVKIKYYKNVNDSWTALRDGNVDATVYTSNAYSEDEWDCLASFGSKPTYIAVAKNRKDLLDEINKAGNEIQEENPAFLDDLYEQYFSDHPIRKSLTAEEQEWADAHPMIRVGGFTNDQTDLSMKNAAGEATGLTPTIVEGMIERLGIKAKASYKCYDSVDQMVKALNSGEIDLIYPFYTNYYSAQQYDLVISNPVRTANMELVHKKGVAYKDALEQIATPVTRLGGYYVEEFFPNAQLVPATSVQDAVDKVVDGHATGAVAYNTAIDPIKEKNADLEGVLLADGCGTCFAAKPEDHAAIRIVNRGLNYYSNSEMAAIEAEFTPTQEVTVGQFLASHKEVVILLVIIAAVLLALIAVLLKMGQMLNKEKTLTKELDEAREQAEAANKSKTAFLFNMSHDIRTPMNAILGFTNIAIKHFHEEERALDSLEKIKTSGGHLLNLINDILEMSRIESGNLELSQKPVDIREVTEGVEEMSRALALSKSIDFHVDVGNIEDYYIYADELHGNEIVINLISNAIKYTPEGGKVAYKIEQIAGGTAAELGIDAPAGERWAMYRTTVSDNGIGMSEEFQEHLFETFSRESSEAVAKTEGAGLGLSIVKRIVDLAGGTISVESKKGVGSTFTIDMPFRVLDEEARAAFAQKDAKEEAIIENNLLNEKRVLLVEDNELNREIATDILQEAGMDVETAEDGGVALAMVREKGIDYYDLILMDIQMPVMNGYETTRAIRQLTGGERIPIVALSANAFAEDIAKSLEAGMNAHIAKPIVISELLETMFGVMK